MSMQKTVEPDMYDIPHNYEDGGGVVGGRFSIRNAAEGIGSAALVVLIVVKLLPVPVVLKALLSTFLGLPLLILGVFGIGGEPVSSFLFYMFRFMTSRRRLIYKRGYTKNGRSAAKQEG
jgi:conjugal transfer ATP-binding protein TraC